MRVKRNRQWTALALVLATAACARNAPPLPIEMPQPPTFVTETERGDPQVRATIVGGDGRVPEVGPAPRVVKTGNIAVNLPNADVRTVAASVQELTGIAIAVDPGVAAQVSLVTPGAVARSTIVGLFESGLRAANLALVQVGNGYIVRTVSAAQAPVSPEAVGFGTEVIALQFINAEEVRKVIDGALPGVVTSVDPAGNRVTIAGTTGQRSSARDLLRQFDVNWLRNMSFALFVPERTDSRLIVPDLEKLINASDSPTRGLVRLIAMERLNGILAITAQPQYLEDVRRWVEILDREGESAAKKIFVYRVQNGRARDLARTLNRAFGTGGDEGDSAEGAPSPDEPQPTTTRSTTRTQSAGTTVPPVTANAPATRDGGAGEASNERASGGGSGRITADEVNNAIVVYGTPREYAVVEDALRKLDLPPYQVLIEAAITEVTLTDSLRYGVQWNWLTGDSNFRLTEGAAAPTAANQPGFSYFLAGGSITAALNALERRTNIKVISAPKLVTLNNQTASLQVGDQVPISSGTAVSVQNPDAPIVNSIEYRDTGVILKVTPRVNAGGLVLLDVAQEVSDVNTNVGGATSSTSASPTISTRRISTSVAVQDGQVIALGGLFRDSKSFGKNGIPILSRIPVLGALFGSHDNTQTRTELIVLLKPHVIRTADDGRAVTEELRAKLRTLETVQDLGPDSVKREREAGYALVAAVASIGVFAAMAMTVLSATRMGFEDASAEQAQLQATAAADAGLAVALSRLLASDVLQRWSIDGRTRGFRFGSARLRIRIEDERGKVPLGVLDETQATRLLEQAGLSGDRLRIAADSLLDWIDDDDDPRPFGAEATYYRAAGLLPPGGLLASVDELALVRGFDAATIARIRPYVTTYTVSTGFDDKFADPRALAVMDAGGEGGVRQIARARDLAGQRTAIEIADPADLADRPISLSSEALLPDGARATRRMIVEVTGSTARPYIVRAYE